jgi:hypothetical protein
MIRKAPDSGWRATALAAALFAITLNFLQPIAHAALLRDGAPIALWMTFCHAAAASPDSKHGSSPAQAVQDHECCLGLAHAQALIDRSPNLLPVVFADVVTLPLPAAEQPTAVGIRDGPHKPRGPPSLA